MAGFATRNLPPPSNYEVHHIGLGITDRIWTSSPLNANAESFLMLDRMGESSNFSLREAKLAATIVCGIRSFSVL